MVGAIDTAIREGADQSIGASRGEGKTTDAERTLLKNTLDGTIKFSVLFAATGGAADDSLESIKLELETNERLFADYPEVCVPIRALEDTPNRAHYQRVSGFRHDNGKPYEAASSKFSWCGKEVYLPKVPGSPASGGIMATRGLDSAVRGLKKKGLRVDVAVVDDPDTEETATSKKQADKLEKRIDRAIAGLGGQKRRTARVMLTTLQNRTCVSYKFTDPKQKHSWKGKRFRFLVTPPTNGHLWQEYVSLKESDWDNGTTLAHEFYVANRDAMDAGHLVANPNRYMQGELSALQFYYDEVARIGLEAVLAEYDNDPVEDDEEASRLLLTAHHIQHGCLSGLDRRIVPDGTVLLTLGADVQKAGLHWTAIAWNEEAAGCIIDYDFFEFRTEGRNAADCELAILEGLWAWHAALEEHPWTKANGEVVHLDLALLDLGWKDESWNTQPVISFCDALGNNTFMPSKGIPNYRSPKVSRSIATGDNWHVTFPHPFVAMNSDHWKLKVHEGFMLERGSPGSLSLFDHPKVDGRPRRNFHMSFAKHQLAESWETRTAPGFRHPETKWWYFGKPNHWFDSTYQAICARSVRGLSTLASANIPAQPEQPEPPKEPRSPSTHRDDHREEEGTTRRRINFRRRT